MQFQFGSEGEGWVLGAGKVKGLLLSRHQLKCIYGSRKLH